VVGSKLLVAGTLFSVLLGNRAINGAPAAAALHPNDSEGRCAALEPGEHLHDGFFFRSESGLSFYWADVSGSAPRNGIRGIGQSGGISIGGTPAHGFVLGGTMWTARIDPVFVQNGLTVTPDDDSVKLTLLRTGPFIAFYPNPTRGFHVQAAALLAIQIESDVKGNPIEPAAFGPAVSIGLGYEWFISDQFSLGLVARAALGQVVRAPEAGSEQMRWFLPDLSISGTYH